MANELEKFSVTDALRDKVRTLIGELLPTAAVDELIKRIYDQEYEKIARKLVEERLHELLKHEINKQIVWDSQMQKNVFSPGSDLEQILTHAIPGILAKLLSGIAARVMQDSAYRY